MGDVTRATQTTAGAADNPIEHAEEDRLGRVPFAVHFANELTSLDAKQGFVTALMGRWGSGKTSLLNLVAEEIKKDNDIVVLHFNPWMFSGTDALVGSFFRELSAQLRLTRGTRFGQIADQLEAYGELLNPLVWLPVVGPWMGRARSLFGGVKKVKDASAKSVGEERKLIQDALKKLEHPLVVIVDDIDRLSSQEIQDIFKLVRLTANFPNMVYVLAFDRDRVESALSSDGISGRKYLEKIVQLGVDLPAPAPADLLKELQTALGLMMTDLGDTELFDEKLWPDTLMDIIFPLIESLRDVRRYAASSRTAVRALKDQVELNDLLALEAIRVFAPDAFAAIRRAPEALTTTRTLGLGALTSDGDHKQLVEDILQTGPDSDFMRTVLRRLFPASIRHFENNSYGSDWLSEWLRDRRVAHSDILLSLIHI